MPGLAGRRDAHKLSAGIILTWSIFEYLSVIVIGFFQDIYSFLKHMFLSTYSFRLN